jgi:hypothetical protein
VAGPGDFGRWVSFSPPEYLDLDVPPGGLLRRFDATLAPPPETADGTYNLVLDAVGDGARYAELEVELTWRRSCEPATSTASPTTAATDTPTPSATPETPVCLCTATPSPTRAPPRELLLPIAMKGHCLGPSRPDSDIVLAVDTSSSMLAEGKLDAALGAAATFVGLVDSSRDQVGVVAFDTAARTVVGLTRDRARVSAALAGLTTAEGTRLDLGLETALDELSGSRARPRARRVLILLTDGRPDALAGARIDAALRRLRGSGTLAFAIGLGSDLDTSLLLRVAGDASRYYPAPVKTDLERIYRRIAETLPCGG